MDMFYLNGQLATQKHRDSLREAATERLLRECRDEVSPEKKRMYFLQMALQRIGLL